MADSFTPLGLYKPEIGASRDTWGNKLNANMDLIDAHLRMAPPIGIMMDWPAGWEPAGWCFCDGRWLNKATYPTLFATIGFNFGGDGVNNFAIPDFRGRMAACFGTGVDQEGHTVGLGPFATKPGTYYTYINQARLPNYQLWVATDGAHVHSGATDAQGYHDHYGATDGQGQHSHAYTRTDASGGGAYAPGGLGLTQSQIATSEAGHHAHNVYVNPAGNHQHNVTVYAGGAHTHSAWLGGSGGAMWTLPPLLVVQKIIYIGQATVVVAAASEPTVLALEAPEDSPPPMVQIGGALDVRLQQPMPMRSPLRGPY